MVPKSTDGKRVLVCRSCGYTADKFSAEKYRITENVRHKHGDILVVEDAGKRKREVDRRYLVDLYGKEMYEFDE
jgi:DNA-directed RNA polymerase subunit M/transcription elongation factor TFIIS